MKKRKKETRTREELIKSNKNKKRIIILLLLVMAYFIISATWNKVSISINPEANGSITSNQSSSEENGDIVEYVKGFMYGILQLEYPWITKLLIFLGIVYLFQISLTISGDIIQLVLIIGVSIFRLVKWIYRKIKGIEYEEDI